MTRCITTIEELKQAATGGGEFFILLCNGAARSSKHVTWEPDDGRFFVWHSIDDSDEELTEEELLDPDVSNIGEAMRKGALFADGGDAA